MSISQETQSGWWFGTFFIFPYIGINPSHWLIFFKMVNHTYMHSHMPTDRETRFEHTPQPPSWLIATPQKKRKLGKSPHWRPLWENRHGKSSAKNMKIEKIHERPWKSSRTSSRWWFQTIFIFHFIYGIILPIDELHHFSEVLKPPTSLKMGVLLPSPPRVLVNHVP